MWLPQPMLPVVSLEGYRSTKGPRGSVRLLPQTGLCLRPTPLPGMFLSVFLPTHALVFRQAQIKVRLLLRTLPHEVGRCPVSTIWMRNWAAKRLDD